MLRTFEYIIAFVVLILFQYFIFDNINIMGYINPYVYIMIIMILPMAMNNAALLLIGFATGALMDLLTGNMGLCAMVCTWLAFIRPGLLILIAGKEVVNNGGSPSIRTLGNGHFWLYITLMTLAYNIPFFLLENMSISEFTHTSLRIISSTIFTIGVIYLSHLLLIRRSSPWQ